MPRWVVAVSAFSWSSSRPSMARRHRLAAATALLLLLGAWTRADAGVNRWTSGVLEAGSIGALQADPAAVGTLYASAARAGVFKSTDGGATWTAVNTGLPSLNVGTLVLDPGAPGTVVAPTAAGTIYAGNPRGELFRSANGGLEWSSLGQVGFPIADLAADPHVPGVVYVGTMGAGVLKSTDGGSSRVSLNTGLTDLWAGRLSIDPATGMLYAGTYGGGVFQLLPVVDVPTTHWAWPSIEAAYAAGLTAGCGTAPPTYCPEGPTTRAQVAVLFLRASERAGFIPPACTTAPFADVPCTDPFAPWIGELARRGITVGCGDENYCPADPTTREQMAVLLLRARLALGFAPPPCVVATFADVPCSNPFAAWVEELVRRGITAGCLASEYCPRVPVQRAEMAVFLVRTFDLLR